MTQVVARIDDALVREVDRLVEAGVFESRSDAVRRGLFAVLDRIRRDDVDRAIVDEYSRSPQTDEEVASAHAAARRMVADEPW
jgi:Arc/MetJ-type ribon-helix-helix transcriptional regulator